MTNLEYLTSITPFSGNTLLLSGVLLDNGVNEDDEYTTENKSLLQVCSAYVVKTLLVNPETKEGSLSVKYDKKELRNYANTIFKNNGLNSEIIINNKINII